MSSTIFTAMTIFGLVGLFIIWGLNNAYPKYNFAMSAFVRMHGHSVIHNHDIKQFCVEWSNGNDSAPLKGLDEVDQYMYYEYKHWRGR